MGWKSNVGVITEVEASPEEKEKLQHSKANPQQIWEEDRGSAEPQESLGWQGPWRAQLGVPGLTPV